MIGLGKGLQLHIIIYHDQAVLQIRPGEGTGLHLGNASGAHIGTQERAHHQTDAAFSLTAVTDQKQHGLPFIAGNQAVAHVFLKCGDVFGVQKLLQKCEPFFRHRCGRIVGNRQTVHAEHFFFPECAIQKQGTVGNVDSVCFHRQRLRIAHEPQGLQKILHLSGKTVGHIGLDLFQNVPHELCFISDTAINCEEGTGNGDHGMFLQIFPTEERFVDFLTFHPLRNKIRLLVHRPLFPPLSIAPAIPG